VAFLIKIRYIRFMGSEKDIIRQINAQIILSDDWGVNGDIPVEESLRDDLLTEWPIQSSEI
jgi:hypothetical protein